MTANASKSKSTENSVMSPIAGKLAETVLLIMQMFGIQKIECNKLKSGEFERLIPNSSAFEGTPPEIKGCGLLVEQAIAEILAAAGIVRLEISSNDEERKMLINSYETIVNTYKAAIEAAKNKIENQEIPVDAGIRVNADSMKAKMVSEDKNKSMGCVKKNGKSCCRKQK